MINLPEVSPIVKPLTHIMFHIEDTCFDQVSNKNSRALGIRSSIRTYEIVLLGHARNHRVASKSRVFQFMANYEATNWSKILTMPLSITLERVRSQILLRPEFKNVGDLSHEDKEVAQSIKRICSFVRSARFK